MIYCLLTLLIFVHPLFSDEGMWPYNFIPVSQIEEKWHVRLSDEWLDHVRLSSVRMSLGGSGSFVSANGLVITNHHVGSKAIFNLSTQEKDLMKDGFYAATFEEELPCPNFYIDQLWQIKDVTDQFPLNASEKERGALIATISKKAEEETGLKAQIITLYNGAKFHLYLYKRYTDVRLVMAPEKQIAFFGGESANFEYPRYDLDICFFRVYEDGKPLKTQNFLKWNAQGPSLDEVLFVSGHPGHTERLCTSTHLRFLKDVSYATRLQYIQERIDCLEKYAGNDEERRRIAADPLFSLYNARKVIFAIVHNLDGPIQKKLQIEQKGKPWSDINEAFEKARDYYMTYFLLEGTKMCKLYSFAKDLVRCAKERTLPNEERLHEYTDSELPQVMLALQSTEPIYLEMEEAMLQDSLKRLSKYIQVPMISLKGTTLDDPKVRLHLFEHPQEVATSTDPLIQLAQALDEPGRAIRQRYESEVDGPLKEAYTRIIFDLFDKQGTNVYPDATFSLRLSLGKCAGYDDIPAMTRFAGLFQTATEEGEYALPRRWIDRKGALNLQMPFNFISTNDIIGGNSGSPVVNQKGEFVGIIFDGNVHSLSWDIEFDEARGRAVSVHAGGIIEALAKIYQADALIHEILGKDYHY